MLLAWLLRALGALVCLFWFCLLADRKRGWPARFFLKPARGDGERGRESPGRRDTVVVVPARNERTVLGKTLPALLSQAVDFFRLIVVDDRSEDGTEYFARELAAASTARAQVRTLTAAPPPPSWSGKVHALEQGVRCALEEAPNEIRWFLFTDADILHHRGSVRALREKAEDGRYDQVSVMARLRAEGFWEKLLIPAFVYFFQLLYPFRRVADPESKVAAAAGGCLLIRRDLLERLGGLEAIREAVIDDVALARLAKENRGRLWLGFSQEIVSLRGYPRLRDVAAMVSRTAFTQLRYSYGLLALTAATMLLVLVSPPILAIAGVAAKVPEVVAAATAAWIVQAWTLFPSVRHHRVAAPFALGLPLAGLLYLWMTLRSAWNHGRGRGVRWRGRVMDSSRS